MCEKSAPTTFSFFFWPYIFFTFLCFFLFLSCRNCTKNAHFFALFTNEPKIALSAPLAKSCDSPPSISIRAANEHSFAANVIRKNYEINAPFRKCYESHLEPIMPDYKQLWPINRVFLSFSLFSSRFLAFSLVFPFLFAFSFS